MGSPQHGPDLFGAEHLGKRVGKQRARGVRCDEDDIKILRQKAARVNLSVVGSICDIMAELAAPN
jgi:hypothetical protein